MPSVGFRFLPTEHELIEFYLYNKITENPVLYEDGSINVIDYNLYGSDVPEPSQIWKLRGGDQLLVKPALYFFTQLKKLSPKSKRFSRKSASGSWHGEDAGKPVLAPGSEDREIGLKKMFKYVSTRNPGEDGCWIMTEFAINPSLLPKEHSHKATDFVLCKIKRSDREKEKDNEKENSVEKPRKRKPVSENNVTADRAFGGKREQKGAMTHHRDIDDILPERRHNKRSRVDDRNHSPRSRACFLPPLESGGELTQSLPDPSAASPVEEFTSHLGVQLNQAIALPSFHNTTQIVDPQGKMETWFDDLDGAEYSSILEKTLEHIGEDLSEWQQIYIESAVLAQQNQPMVLQSSNNNTLQSVDFEAAIESLPAYQSVDQFLSQLDREEEAVLHQQSVETYLKASISCFSNRV